MSGKPGNALRAAVARYRDLPLMARMHLFIRRKTCPFGRIEPFVPREGLVYDLGCGHGLFSICLALSSQRRRVIGCDLSEKKIAIARKAAKGIPNLEFRGADAGRCDLEPCQAVVLLDVLYLMDDPACAAMLSRCRERLVPNGILLVKETDTRPRWKYLWMHAQELLAVKLFGITLGSRLYFRGRKEAAGLLRAAGFTVETERIDAGYPYPHIVYVCRNQRAGAAPQ